MARTGKIARLPREVREELNGRLADGVPAYRLLEWLNGLEPVRAIQNKYFDGKPINEPNITAWRSAGYIEWKESREAEAMAKRLWENPERLAEGEMSRGVAVGLAVKLAQLSRQLLDKSMPPRKQWKRFCEVHQQVSRLRKDDHRSTMMTIKREQWTRDKEQVERGKEGKRLITDGNERHQGREGQGKLRRGNPA